ncbi:MAG: YhbY family RNA-binding protein, partial [SAR324 cluster bacterium]|nr:YhbY family RNA-binding protein [SAR324 cluster bacterium]
MTGKQKRYLRSLAHSLKPVVQIGKQGLSRETLVQIEKQLDDHELIKGRVLEASPQDHREC